LDKDLLVNEASAILFITLIKGMHTATTRKGNATRSGFQKILKMESIKRVKQTRYHSGIKGSDCRKEVLFLYKS
jgi:hypothetical protein